MIKNTLPALFCLLLACSPASAKVTLPRLIGDGMVLQRNTKVKIWGWADAGEKVTVQFIGKTYTTVTDRQGNWAVMLPRSRAGGPFQMTVNGDNTIIINDILIGDVWVCSGQSNMEISMDRVSPLYQTEIAHSENTFIRYFEVPKKYDFNSPHTDLSGGQWQSVNPEGANLYNAEGLPASPFRTDIW